MGNYTRRTTILVPPDIDQIVKEYQESQKDVQPDLNWTQALYQLARKGATPPKN